MPVCSACGTPLIIVRYPEISTYYCPSCECDVYVDIRIDADRRRWSET